MEKLGVIREDITPKLDVVENGEKIHPAQKPVIAQLDADFRKQAAAVVHKQLK